VKDFTLTEEAARKLKRLINQDKYQPPRRYHNTRPFEGGGAGSLLECKVVSIAEAVSGPYTGLVVATVTVKGSPPGQDDLVSTELEVVDHSGCILDLPVMTGYTVWAAEMVFLSLDATAACDEKTPIHWAAVNRCCSANSGLYADPC